MCVSKCNGPLCTSLHGVALHQKDRIIRGVKRLGKLLQFNIWHLRSLLGPQPDENPREYAASQLDTTRKTATRSAPIFVTRSACPHAASTTPLVIYYP
jgi:hypothetical protein